MRMKKIFLISVGVLFLLVCNIFAQTSSKKEDKQKEKICCNSKMWSDIPDLTNDQIKKIEDLQIAHLKEVNQTKALIQEKRAHLKTLQTADKPDNNEINKTIDEITSLQNEMMKKHEAHRQAIRNILNDKQRAIYDAKLCGKKHGNKGNCCKGNHHMKDNCNHSNNQAKGCCRKN